MKYHIAKKHSKATARIVHECKGCHKDFHSFHLMREHKREEHGAERSSGAQNANVTQLLRDIDDHSLKEDLETCELVRWRTGDIKSTTLPWIL